MSTKFRIVVLAVVIVAVVVGIVWMQRPAERLASTPIGAVHYLCDGGKTIDASFYAGTTTPPTSPGEPPVPSGSAEVSLSDGRVLTLAQTISADGVRYSNGDPMVQGSETFVFWSKGNGALVLEDNKEKSYIGCLVVASLPAGSDLVEEYATSSLGFSVRYAPGYTIDGSYRYETLGPGKDIFGVKFTIPLTTTAGANLASDSYFSVESIPQTSDCNASLFLDHATAEVITDVGTIYSIASTTGAGAGNRYEETVYAFPDTNPCLAVRYFVHYGAIENYPAGTVAEFDRAALLREFDAMRRTLMIR